MTYDEYPNNVDFHEKVTENNLGEIGEWELVDTEIVEWLTDIVVSEYEYHKTDEPSNHLIHWKHKDSDTHLKITKDTAISGYDGKMHYNGRVTISGISITIGENKYSESFKEVLSWGVGWMEENDDVSHLYD